MVVIGARCPIEQRPSHNAAESEGQCQRTVALVRQHSLLQLKASAGPLDGSQLVQGASLSPAASNSPDSRRRSAMLQCRPDSSMAARSLLASRRQLPRSQQAALLCPGLACGNPWGAPPLQSGCCQGLLVVHIAYWPNARVPRPCPQLNLVRTVANAARLAVSYGCVTFCPTLTSYCII